MSARVKVTIGYVTRGEPLSLPDGDYVLTPAAQQGGEPCKGKDCASVDGANHSAACQAEHNEAIGTFDSNNEPQARYAGYKGHPLPDGATDAQKHAYAVGKAAAAPAVPAVECEKCNGHGATHYPDGEWESKCADCKGTGVKAQAVQQSVELPQDERAIRDAIRAAYDDGYNDGALDGKTDSGCSRYAGRWNEDERSRKLIAALAQRAASVSARYVETQPGSPNFDGADAFEAHLGAKDDSVSAKAVQPAVKSFAHFRKFSDQGHWIQCHQADYGAIAAAFAAPAPAASVPDAGLEKALVAAVGKLIKAKGRFHTEQNYAAVVTAHDAMLAAAPTPPQAPSTLPEQVARTQAEVATWTEERRRNVRLTGGDQP